MHEITGTVEGARGGLDNLLMGACERWVGGGVEGGE
jgi:hypothetical protein